MTDYTSLTDEELHQIRRDVVAEQERRNVLREAEQQVQNITARALVAEGVEEGQPWQETLLGYLPGWTVTHPLPDSTAIGTWVNVRPGNRYAPGSPGGGWELQPPDADTPPLWVKPAWAEVGYMTGDEVTFPTYADGDVYRSIIDKNTWSPTEYPEGWELVSAEPEPDLPGDEIPVWVKPVWAGEAGGAYALGDQVHFPTADDPVYESTHDGWNTWSPDEYGWSQV